MGVNGDYNVVHDDVGDWSRGAIPMARPVRVFPQPGLLTHPMLLDDMPRRVAWLDLAALLVLMVVVSEVIERAALMWIDADAAADPRVIPVLATLFRGAVLTSVVHLTWRRRGQRAASVGLCARPWWAMGLLGVGGGLLAFLTLFATMGMLYLMDPGVIEAFQDNPEKIAEQIPRWPPVALLAVCAAVGFYEELIFRGYLLTRLRRATGSAAVAVILSAVAFSAVHWGQQVPVIVIPLFGIGVVWAVLTLATRSVVPAIIGHTLFNGIQFMGLYYAYPDWR
ncbi:MAG: CPBP family intramembrane metalloprotease [Phycisphaerales bacterium]|nr:CPBP family intramembrane metalloprotease [Phycisphaerales bacterium]